MSVPGVSRAFLTVLKLSVACSGLKLRPQSKPVTRNQTTSVKKGEKLQRRNRGQVPSAKDVTLPKERIRHDLGGFALQSPLNANDHTGTPQKVTWKVTKERPEGHGSITYMNDCTKAKVSMEKLIGRANDAGLIQSRGEGITTQGPCSRTPAPSPRMQGYRIGG